MNARTKCHLGRLLAALVLLFLALAALPQTAYVQGPTPPAPSGPVPAPAGTESAALGPNCSSPPSGYQAKLRAESEIVIVNRWEDSNDRLRFVTLDASGSGLTYENYHSYSTDNPNIRWPSITTADLNGDGRPESVMAFRNADKNLSVRIPEYGTQPGDYWSSNYDRHSGGDVKYIDVAAGDLYRSGDDEVVIAFRDDKDDLHLVLLNGDSTGGISPGNNTWNRWYWSDSGGRGYVSQVCVATGDLDGDGYNDEIVTAFVDGNYHLQVQMFESISYPNLTNIWGKSWTNVDRDYLDDGMYSDDRLVDVTTGDLDGDFEDEVIIALVDDNYGGRNEGKVQVLVLDRTGTWTFDDSTYVQIDSTPGYSLNLIDWVDPQALSVAAGDIDGDGKAEICLAYDLYVRQGATSGNKHTYPHLWTYDYVRAGPGGLQARANSHWTSTASPWDHVSRIQTAAGDIDMDGRAEIAMSFRDENGELQTLVFEGESGLTQSRSYNFHTSDDSCDLGEFWIAMGDVDGDTSYGNYTGNCWETTETQVTAVLYVPPHYSAYNRASGAAGSAVGYGKHTGKGGSTATGASISQRGSVTIDESISFADIFEAGPSFTYEFEKSLDISTEVVTMTCDGLHMASDMFSNIWDLVTFDKVKYWVYEYRESRSGQTFQLRIPKGYTSSNRGLDLWYSEGPTEFGDSWVPVGQNVARGRTATQSSTYSTAAASRAVDNDADGNYASGSVSHTNREQNAWWQVDLGRIQWLDAIQLWNRTDCCADRLSNFYVFVSDTAFTSTNPNQLVSWGIWNQHITGQAGRPTTVIPNRSGRYVRVQLAGTNYLQLAEVQVWGHPSEVAIVQDDSIVANSNQWPTERPTAIDDNSFQVKLPDGTYQTVDGHLHWTWTATLGIDVDRGSTALGWDTTADTEWTTSVETTTAESVSIGFEAKVMGAGVEGSYAYGSETRTSRAYTWSTSTLVEGQAGSLDVIGPYTAPVGLNYNYSPYIWIQKTQSTSGVPQEFMVVSYWVGSFGSSRGEEPPQPAAGPSTLPRAGKLITPTVPIIASPSHPNPATWYPTSTVVVTWTQPAGDPATIAGYRWYMDSQPDTVLSPASKGLTTTHTFEGVPDGLWYAHVRATSDGYEWSDTGHRAVRVDTNPPQVKLALDPPQPTGNSDWYNTPLTVTVNATDGAGSGVATIEVSTDDQASWQPYTPLFYTTDTPTATVWARATDAVGHTSEPVSTTFKIDLTPPSSEIHYSGYIFGVWIATVVTDTLGNQHLVLGGIVSDTLSGRAGMGIQANGGDWTSASALGEWHPIPGMPEIEVNWYYTATTELGRGNHTFFGQAQDQAGNLEAPYQIAQVIWFPPSTPDLSASSLTVSPQVARPGDEVTFVVAVRNSGQQEAQVSIVDTLPAGLTPVTETLGYEAVYDPGAGTITWPARLLWPGQWSRVTFSARVDAASAAVLENQVTAHAGWPNTDALTGAARQYFLDRERTVVMTATLTVDPSLPAGADITPPQANLGLVNGPAVVTQRQVDLEIWADPDARWMFLREWTLHPSSGTWTVAQESGWVRYAPTTTWTLSPGDGVKYLGVWVADWSQNVSLLDEHSLTYVNLVGTNQALAAGGRTQYRFELKTGDLAAFYVTALAGDPDLYIWKPLQALRPNYYSNGPGGAGTVDEIVEWLDEGGRYLVEVQAVGDSQYQLTMPDESQVDTRDRTSRTRMLSFQEKDRPAHPLAVSDPLSAGSAVAPPTFLLPYEIYFPLAARDG